MQRGAAAGFAFRRRSHVCNTFDAHRLLHWAGLQGRSLALERALLLAYHERGENLARHDVLLGAAREVGLAADAARAVLEGDAHAAEVRATVQQWRRRGIASVPTIVVDGRHAIQGGQSADVFAQMLRRVARGHAAGRLEAPAQA